MSLFARNPLAKNAFKKKISSLLKEASLKEYFSRTL
jgi:hypothetical protein